MPFGRIAPEGCGPIPIELPAIVVSRPESETPKPLLPEIALPGQPEPGSADHGAFRLFRRGVAFDFDPDFVRVGEHTVQFDPKVAAADFGVGREPAVGRSHRDADAEAADREAFDPRPFAGPDAEAGVELGAATEVDRHEFERRFAWSRAGRGASLRSSPHRGCRGASFLLTSRTSPAPTPAKLIVSAPASEFAASIASRRVHLISTAAGTGFFARDRQPVGGGVDGEGFGRSSRRQSAQQQQK